MHLIRHDDTTSYETKTRYRRCIRLTITDKTYVLDEFNSSDEFNSFYTMHYRHIYFVQLNSSELNLTIVRRMKQVLVWSFFKTISGKFVWDYRDISWQI
jgi:hypothetical protein